MSIGDILDHIFSIVVFIFAVMFAVWVFRFIVLYNDTLNDETHTKASSRYTLAYWDSENLIEPSQVYADIMQEDEDIVLQIDGLTLNPEYLRQARENDIDGIRRLLSGIKFPAYKKIVEFNSSGNVIAINYRGEKHG